MENKKKRIVAIIPARGGSKRLQGKNIYMFKGKPLMVHTIDACKASSYIDEIYVSSDDDEILNVAEANGCIALRRPVELADDTTPKIVAIRQAFKDPSVSAMGEPDIVIIPQANSPQITSEQINCGFELMFKHNLWEVMSANSNGVQNAAFRIVTKEALFNEFLSAHCGFVVAENIDVHTLEDLQNLEK
jgi:CMP-N,N'-diacetyllegionaminic acid synthase